MVIILSQGTGLAIRSKRAMSRKNELVVLIKRIRSALFSGQRSAYLALLVMALSPLTRVLDGLFQKKSANQGIPPCVLIIGGSRSGSTIIYQVLTRAVTSVYVSNLHVLFPNLGHRLMKKFKGYGSASLDRKNYYGYTASLYDVNEANKELDKVFHGDPDTAEIRRRFASMVRQIGGSGSTPFFLKNVRHSEKLLQLEKAVPELFFLKIDRDLHQTAQSVLRAYWELGYFHPIPHALEAVPVTDPVEFAAREVLEIERELNSGVDAISPERRLRWTYESFCESPTFHLQQLNEKAFNGNARIDLQFMKEPLRSSTRLKVTEKESEGLQMALEKYGPL